MCKRSLQSWSRDACCCLVIGAVVLGGFSALVAQPRSLIVDPELPSWDEHVRPELRTIGNDLTRYHLPRWLWIERMRRENGRIPSWDPPGFCGRPLVGNPQAGLHYPLIWITRWVGEASSLGWLTVAHLIFGGWGAYFLGSRACAMRRPAATLSGIAFGLAPPLIAHLTEGHYPHLWAVAWYPWAFLSTASAMRGSRQASIALPFVLSLALMTGHPQEGAFLVMALVLWVSFQIVRGAWKREWPTCWRLTWLAFATGFASIGLTAIEWLPMAGVADEMSISPLGARGGTLYEWEPVQVVQLLSPGLLGGPSEYRGPHNFWEAMLAPGTVSFTLALIGVVFSRNRVSIRGWCALALGGLWFAAGRDAGLFNIAECLPGVASIRTPGRALLLSALAMAMLAGHGLDSIERSQRLRDFPFGLPSRWSWLPRGLVALVSLELVATTAAWIKLAPPERFLAPDSVSQALAALELDSTARIRAEDGFYSDLDAARDGIEKVNVGDRFHPAWNEEMFERLFQVFSARPRRKFETEDVRESLDRLGVTHLIGSRPEPDLGLLVVARGIRDRRPYKIYENPTAWPRAYVTSDDARSRRSIRLANDSAKDPDLLRVEVSTTAPGVLHILDTMCEGWSATVDGKPAAILRGDRWYRTVRISSPGDHIVVLTYDPPLLSEGYWISALSALTLGVVYVVLVMGPTKTRSTRLPSISTTSNRQPSQSSSSPTRGMRPTWAMRNPARV
jgi:hypothetical protein